MSAIAMSHRFSFGSLRGYYRPLILAAIAVVLLYSFWITSGYPSLLSKAAPSMAYSSELWPVAADAPLSQKIAYGAVNWLCGMKVGMNFGVLFGALLHAFLRYYPLKIRRNLDLNSLIRSAGRGAGILIGRRQPTLGQKRHPRSPGSTPARPFHGDSLAGKNRSHRCRWPITLWHCARTPVT